MQLRFKAKILKDGKQFSDVLFSQELDSRTLLDIIEAYSKGLKVCYPRRSDILEIELK